MKKLTLIFTLLVSTAMFSSPSYSKWTKVGEGVSGMTYYVDFKSMKKHGGYVTYWVLRDYLKPDKFGNLSGKTYYQGDCKLFRYKSLIGSFHKEPMGGGSSVNYSPKNPDWKYPPSNSVIEKILKSYCSSEV
jgi:hypothetical protein